jgi:hypothetical protein
MLMIQTTWDSLPAFTDLASAFWPMRSMPAQLWHFSFIRIPKPVPVISGAWNFDGGEVSS